ncbi:MAG: response regulator [Acidimicrobiia bacterium]
MLANTRVLVVEDEHVNRLVITKLLEVIGAMADVVNNGAEALEAVQTRSYDLVLMDCHMPVLDGFEATRAIRELTGAPTSNRVPIVALTADSKFADAQRCWMAGMDDHLNKPVDRIQLAQTLERWVAV